MPISPEFITRLAGQVLAYAGSAEVAVTQAVAGRVGKGIDRDDWAAQKLLGVRALQDELLRIAAQFTTDVSPAARTAVERGAAGGQAAAKQELYAALKHLEPRVPGLQAVIELAAEALEPVTGGAATTGILRAATDAYRAVVAEASSHVVSGSLTRRQAAQRALDRWATRGVVAFVDRRGREWDMVSYAEMATRAASQRAMIAAHGATLRDNGVNLVIVSNAPQECKRCRPWEGKVLTLGPSDGRNKSLADAQAAGFMHPGAILGNERVRALGRTENAVRARYEGPSVHLTTARGYRLTVSPNHPVLTSNGWRAADLLCEGDQVFTQPGGRGSALAPRIEHEAFDQMPPTFDDVLDAVGAHGRHTSVPSAADHLHGDGRFCQGEIDVVWANSGLLPIVDSGFSEHLCHGCLIRADVELFALTGGGSALQLIGGVRHTDSVARSLANGDATRLQPASQRRLADVEDPGEVLAGLACGVSPDKLVHIDRQWFTGHAYDLQTTTGAYLAADILVHNCRHSIGAYIPGFTEPHAGPTADPEGDAARQRLRELERRVRAARRLEAAALDEPARKAAQARVRAIQAQIREHLSEGAGTTLQRQPARERIGAAR